MYPRSRGGRGGRGGAARGGAGGRGQAHNTRQSTQQSIDQDYYDDEADHDSRSNWQLSQRPQNQDVSNDDEQEEDYCPDCGDGVPPESESVKCDTCSYWFHIKCQKVPKETYKVLSKDSSKTNQLTWNCYHCSLSMKTVRERVDFLLSQSQASEKKLTAISKRQDETDSKIQRNTEEIKKIKNAGANGASAGDVIREIKRRNKATSGIVIHKIKESSSASADDRVAHDTSEFEKICTDNLELNEVPETSGKIFRPGKKNDQGPRPMKVRLKDPQAVQSILSAYRTLSKTKKLQFSIGRELTILQREEGKELRRIRDERQADLDQKNIKDFKWVVNYEEARVVKIKIDSD